MTLADRYEAPREGEAEAGEPVRIRQPTGLLLLDDLRRLFLSTQDVDILWVMLTQAALAKRDKELLELCTECEVDTIAQAHWLQTRIKESAPQALTV